VIKAFIWSMAHPSTEKQRLRLREKRKKKRKKKKGCYEGRGGKVGRELGEGIVITVVSFSFKFFFFFPLLSA